MSYSKKDVNKRLKEFKEYDYVSDRNKELFKDFIDYLKADRDVGESRQYKYVSLFKSLFKNYIDINLDKATKKDLRKIVGKIEASDYSEWTKHDFKVAIKKFYRTIYEDKFERPKRIKKILNAKFMKNGTNIKNQKELEALDPEEVMKLVEQGNNVRDKLIPLFFFETGARISEIMDIKLEDIELNQKYADVEVKTLKNDKGPRTLTLTRSMGLLQRWLEEHPRGDDPQASLFVNLGRKSRGNEITGRNIYKILQRLGEEADIDKRTNPHAFRHAAATYYGTEKSWSQTRMMYWFGWKDSSMAEKYCHEDEDRMRAQKLAEEGIDKKENSKDDSALKECPRCGNMNPPTSKYCSMCSLALDKDTAREEKKIKEAGEELIEKKMEGKSQEEIDEEKDKIIDQIESLKDRVESLE